VSCRDGTVKGEAIAWAFTHHSRSHTHTTETLTARTEVPSQRATPASRRVPLFDSSHTHTLTGASSSLRLDPRFPEAECPTWRKPDEFIEWCSGVKQLELVAPGEGPWTKKSLGNSMLKIKVLAPHKFSTWCPSGNWSNHVIWVWGLLSLSGTLHCLWAGWRFFPYLQKSPATVNG